MSKMQSFVKGGRDGRVGSPQNGPPSVNPNRQTIAANARVQMKPGLSRPSTAQGLSARGESVVQHQFISMQQPLQRRPSGEGQKRDPYDTDAESLDTTVNHSVVQGVDGPHADLHMQPENEQSVAGGEEEQQEQQEEEGEEASGEDDEYDGEGEFEIDEAMNEYLAEHDLAHASYDDRLQFLQKTQPQLFPTIDGDSYPTTTDGNPTEWDEQQGAPFGNLGSPSPSSQHLPQQGPGGSRFNQRPGQQMPLSNELHNNTAMAQSSKLYRQGAQIRGQQRADGALQAREQQHDIAHLPTSQLPIYNHVSHDHAFAAPSAIHGRQEMILHGSQAGLSHQVSKLPSVPGRTQNSVPKITEPVATSRYASTVRAKIVPIVQKQPEPAPVEQAHVFADGDYDTDVLLKMDYSQLRDESFDKNPREGEPVLPEDMHGKSLVERLQYAQQRLDPTAQSEFFSALLTNEWEDAGDWFMDRFTAIIQKTKDARRKKRKAAQDFEREIEARHKYVAKKQRLVEGAMVKMKTQGERLVPKSPRASKSPRPRRG